MVALEADANAAKDVEEELKEAIASQAKHWSMIQSLLTK